MADYILQIPIEEAKVADLKEGFLASNPKDPESEVSNIDWVILKVKQYLDLQATKGLKKLRDRSDPVTTDFFVEE